MVHAITSECGPDSKANCSRVSKMWNANVGWSREEAYQKFINACKHGHIELVRQSIRHPKFDPSEGFDVAVANGQAQIVSLLLDDPRVIIHSSTFNTAVEKGHVDVVKLFLGHPLIQLTNAHLNWALNIAVRYHHIDVATLFLNHPRFSPTSHDILSDAVSVKDPDMVKLLLRDGRFDPSYDDNHALVEAARVGHTEIFNLLMNDVRLVDPAGRGRRNRALVTAAQFGHIEIVDILLRDPRINPSELALDFALSEAVRYEHADVAARLLKHPRVTVTDEAIEIAVRNNDLDMVQLFSKDVRNMKTAFWMALTTYRDDIIELLLKDPQRNPLHGDNRELRTAIQWNLSRIASLLLQSPWVDPSANSNEAIRMAAALGKTKLVKLLLAHPRVDPTAKNNEALRKANANGHDDVVQLLLANSPGAWPTFGI